MPVAANFKILYPPGPYYYEFARHLMKLTASEGEAIGDSIRGTFKTRFREIMDASQNASEVDTVKVTNKMDELERLLYKEGQVGVAIDQSERCIDSID